MPFQIKDETAGRLLFYVNDAGQLGLGSFANSAKLSVNGTPVYGSSGAQTFSSGMVKAGVQLNQIGQVFVPANSQAAVLLSSGVQPQLTSQLTAAAASAAGFTLENLTTVAVVTNYSIW